MSMAPEYVKRLEEIVAEHRALGRKLASLLHDGSMGTASGNGPCSLCDDKGVVFVGNGSAPCHCDAGQTFRQAASAQRAKHVGRERAVGERDE